MGLIIWKRTSRLPNKKGIEGGKEVDLPSTTEFKWTWQFPLFRGKCDDHLFSLLHSVVSLMRLPGKMGHCNST